MSSDISKSVRDRIRSRPAVTNLIGDRIFAGVRDQGSGLPAVVVQVVGNSPEHDLTGTNRIYPSVVMVSALALDRDKANELAKQLRDDALPADLSGSVEGMQWNEVTLDSGPTEIDVEPQDGSDTWIRVTEQTFVIWNAAV
jgi:hypothetical protein